MQGYFNYINKKKRSSNTDEVLTAQEIRKLICQFQNEDLAQETREVAFKKIMELTRKLTE